MNYTVIETLNETVVTPVGSSFVNESGVTNIYVQSTCLTTPSTTPTWPTTWSPFATCINALDPAHTHAPNCLTAFPYPA